jgi:large subunit ribosomal protein L6
MSRVGKKPISIPAGVTVTLGTDTVEVKGPKGALKTTVPGGISLRQDGGALHIERGGDEFAALHGLTRALVANSVKGVTEGFSQQMDVVGVGYKAEVKGQTLVFALGYSHPVEFELPKGVDCKVEKMQKQIPQYQVTLTLTGIDKQELGQVAAKLNRLRKPDAYKGKGIRYADRVLRLKAGKTGGKGGKK